MFSRVTNWICACGYLVCYALLAAHARVAAREIYLVYLALTTISGFHLCLSCRGALRRVIRHLCPPADTAGE